MRIGFPVPQSVSVFFLFQPVKRLSQTLRTKLKMPQVNHNPGNADPTHIRLAQRDPLHM